METNQTLPQSPSRDLQVTLRRRRQGSPRTVSPAVIDFDGILRFRGLGSSSSVHDQPTRVVVELHEDQGRSARRQHIENDRGLVGREA